MLAQIIVWYPYYYYDKSSNLYIPLQFLRSHSLCSNLHYSYILKLLAESCCWQGN
jgi:hypothetical protein